MFRSPIFTVKDCDTIGLESIPLNSLVLNKYNGDIFQITNTTGVLSTTKFCDITGKVLITSNGRLRGNALFYGGWTAANTYSNKLTILSSTGSLVQAESSIGTARYSLAGANIYTNALFYGGGSGGDGTYGPNTVHNTLTILNSSGSLVQAELNIGTAREQVSGANVGANALFYGGYKVGGLTGRTTILTSSGTLAIAEINSGLYMDPYVSSSVSVNNASTVLVYGIYTNVFTNEYRLVSSIGVLLTKSNITQGSIRGFSAGANVEVNALYYAGYNGSVSINTTILLTPNATLIQAESRIGTARMQISGANIGINAIFYNGIGSGGVLLNSCTLISPTTTLVQLESSIGTSRHSLAGASI